MLQILRFLPRTMVGWTDFTKLISTFCKNVKLQYQLNDSPCKKGFDPFLKSGSQRAAGSCDGSQ